MNKYKIGKIIEVEVIGIEKYGIFVNVDKSYKGLIHISEITKEFVKNIYDYVETGEIIRAKIISVNEKKHHIKLSIKDFEYRINARKKYIVKRNKIRLFNIVIKVRWMDRRKNKRNNKWKNKKITKKRWQSKKKLIYLITSTDLFWAISSVG